MKTARDTNWYERTDSFCNEKCHCATCITVIAWYTCTVVDNQAANTHAFTDVAC